MTRPRPASLPAAVRRAMIAQAVEAVPNECCGLLVGQGRRVDFAIPMRNADRRPRTRFRLDPREHIAVRRALRQMVPGSDILGVYHSHPNGPAMPSPRDVAQSHYPDWLFAVIDPSRGLIRVFEIRDGKVRRVAVRWRGRRARAAR